MRILVTTEGGPRFLHSFRIVGMKNICSFPLKESQFFRFDPTITDFYRYRGRVCLQLFIVICG